jgi:hypothetical protein
VKATDQDTVLVAHLLWMAGVAVILGVFSWVLL